MEPAKSRVPCTVPTSRDFLPDFLAVVFVPACGPCTATRLTVEAVIV